MKELTDLYIRRSKKQNKNNNNNNNNENKDNNNNNNNNNDNNNSATKDNNKNNKNNKLTFVDPQSIRYEAVVKFVDTKVPLQSITASEKTDELMANEKAILVGLHTCGNLSCSLIDLFCNNNCISGLVFVGCCYNMLTLPSQHTKENPNCNFTFPMSKSAKDFQMNKTMAMLGCQAVARWADSETHLQESMDAFSKNHYRSMFQVFLRDTYGINQLLSVGPMPEEYTTDFTKYTKRALLVLDKKISQIGVVQLPEDQLNEAIHTTLDKYDKNEKLMKIWWSIRGVFANVIESIILVDRFLYLQEKGFSKSSIFPLFDPILSPRSYCIISIK